MGVWIEIISDVQNGKETTVAPLVGVWIEMSFWNYIQNKQWSLPSWECGLKLWGVG